MGSKELERKAPEPPASIAGQTEAIDTNTLAVGALPPGDTTRLQIYNGLDNCVTEEVWNRISQFLDPADTQMVYEYERALQGPAMEMTLRGIRIDIARRHELINELEGRKQRLQEVIDKLATAVWGKGLNPQSPKQFKEFFYTPAGMNAKTIYKFEKGEKKVNTDREALEKLATYFYCRPIAKAVLAFRDVNKKIGTLRTKIDADNRMRFGIKVAGTETGRWASAENPWKTGTNGQNWTDELKEIFIADEGMKIAYGDLMQAESRAVAYISGDQAYIEACETGDVHTMVAKMVWPELHWTGDLKQDKKIAEQPFYRWFTYRDMAKRGQHGSNYYGSAYTMAKHLHVEKRIMEDFQARYFAAFPGIAQWQKRVIQQLQMYSTITTPLGRKRCFWGRPDNQQTWREAIAFVPQSMIGDLMNRAILRIWRVLGFDVQILMQVHDAVLFQYPEHREEELLPRVLDLMEIPARIGDRTMVIPGEVEVGWNWKHRKDKPDGTIINPDGIMEWEGHDNRERQRNPSSSLLDCRLS